MNLSLDAAACGQFVLGGDLAINRLGFGAMRITGAGVWGDPPDISMAVRVLRRAVHLGVNFIDTADAYGPEVSENLLTRALYPYPADLVIATKGGLVRPGPGDWVRDGRPVHLREACEASLKRLRRDRIDLYQLHAPDPAVPLEESVGELARLRTEGKVRHIGVSNVSLSELQRCERIVPVVAVQNRFNLRDRTGEDVLEHCALRGTAFLPWAPLGSGSHAQGKEALPALASLAERRGISTAQVAIAWLLQRAPVVVPIPGTASIAHLEDNIAAAAIVLTPDELRSVS
ncbi:MAG: aldo/keto reductase [Steroidobacteraceae bacterium]